MKQAWDGWVDIMFGFAMRGEEGREQRAEGESIYCITMARLGFLVGFVVYLSNWIFQKKSKNCTGNTIITFLTLCLK